MIDCTNADIRDRLPDLLHERLDAATRAAVTAHVERCAACQEEVALLRALRGELSRAPALDRSAVARVVVSRTTAAESGEPRAESDPSRLELDEAAVRPLRPAPRQRRQRRWTDWRIAAAIAVLALGSASVTKVLRSRSSAITPDSAVAVVPTPVTETPATTRASGASGAFGASTSVRAEVPPAAARVQTTELSMGGGVSDLSDQDLRALLEEIQGLDALPDVEPEPVTVRVAPLTPGSAE